MAQSLACSERTNGAGNDTARSLCARTRTGIATAFTARFPPHRSEHFSQNDRILSENSILDQPVEQALAVLVYGVVIDDLGLGTWYHPIFPVPQVGRALDHNVLSGAITCNVHQEPSVGKGVRTSWNETEIIVRDRECRG